MKVTRRQLAGALAGSAAALAQSASEKPQDDLAIERKEARENAEALAKVDVPMTLEPAFAFRP